MRQEMKREDYDTLVRAWDELNRAALRVLIAQPSSMTEASKNLDEKRLVFHETLTDALLKAFGPEVVVDQEAYASGLRVARKIIQCRREKVISCNPGRNNRWSNRVTPVVSALDDVINDLIDEENRQDNQEKK